jgi:hypothetical protein
VAALTLGAVLSKTALAAAPGASSSTTVLLTTCEDTYLYAKTPATPYGTASSLSMGDIRRRRMLIRWDLSAIPKTATIVQARLSLYATRHSGSSEDLIASLMPVSRPWTENGATWWSSDGTTPWTNPGGDCDSAAAASFGSVVTQAEVNQWHTADMTAVTQRWVENSLPNYGVLIDCAANSTTSTHLFVSSEGLDGLRPTLEITYTDSSRPVSVTLSNVEDTYLYAKQPTTNFGNAAELWLHDNRQRRILLRWDLSSIPQTAHILSAKLALYADLHASYAAALDPSIMPVLAPWTENGATWNTRDGTTPWKTPGGEYDLGTFDFFAKPINFDEVNQWHTADISLLVQAWVSGGLPNYGAAIDDIQGGSTKMHRFVSSEGPASFRPQLQITYIDKGTLTPPDSFVDPEILQRADSHVYQQLDADWNTVFNDMQEIGGRIFYLATDLPLSDQADTAVDAALARGLTVILPVGVYKANILGSSDEYIYALGAELAEKYRGRVTWYNLHGEVNNAWYETGDPLVSPASVTRYVRALHAGIKSKDPNAKVALMELGGTRTQEYIKECLSWGLGNDVEMLGNGQNYGPSKFSGLSSVILKYRGNTRQVSWLLEEGQKAGHVISYQEEGMMKAVGDSIVQAKVIALKTLLNHHAGLLPNEWYKLYDRTTQDYQLVSDDFRTKFKGFYTLKYLNQYVSPISYAPIKLGISTSTTNLIKLAFKAADNDVVVALWDPRSAPTDSFSPGIRTDVTLLDYGLIPIAVVDPITGARVNSPEYAIQNGRITVKNVEVVDYPRLILMGSP